MDHNPDVWVALAVPRVSTHHCPPPPNTHSVPVCLPVCVCLQVGAVVVGFDRYINYYKIQYATLCIRENPGCLFIATNRDAVTHLTDAQVGRQLWRLGVVWGFDLWC